MTRTVVDLQSAIPDAYNDTVLRDRISRLGAENDAPEARLARLEGDVDRPEGDGDEEGAGAVSTLGVGVWWGPTDEFRVRSIEISIPFSIGFYPLI